MSEYLPSPPRSPSPSGGEGDAVPDAHRVPSNNAVDPALRSGAGRGHLYDSLLHDLVRVASPSGQEADAVRLLTEWMAAHGAIACIDAVGNAVGVWGTGERLIVLLGHIDTYGGVPPVRLDGRVLYGRGAVDAKGSLCAFAAAASQAPLPPDVRVMVVGAVEEECATSAGARHIAAQVTPDMCIIGEPSGWDRLTLGYKGRVQLNARWQIAHAHTAAQHRTAPEAAFAWWAMIQAYVESFNGGRVGAFDTLSATLLRVHSASDGLTDSCEARVSLRLPPNVSPDVIAAALMHDEAGGVFTSEGHERAYLAEKDSALTRLMRGAIRAEGGTPRYVHKTGTSDMNVVGTMWACPIVAYGAGDSSLDHTPNEHIDLDEYQRAIRVLTRVLAQV